MREVARFQLLGSKCVPWSVPAISRARIKGKWRQFIRTDKALVAFKRRITEEARIAMGDAPAVLGPVRVVITFYRETPPGRRHGDYWDARVEPAGGKQHVKRGGPLPDLANLFKGAEDALQGVIIGDDAQTCEIIARRLHGPQDGLDVVVFALEPGDESAAWPFALAA